MRAVAHAVVTAILGLAAGCGTVETTQASLERFINCDTAARCGLLGASEVPGCRDALAAAASRPRAFSRDASIAAGRLRFDNAAALRCWTALQATACAEIPDLLAGADCARTLVGQVATGGDCYGARECADGYCDTLTQGCKGTCRAFTATGAPCDPTTPPCRSGDACFNDGTTTAATCHGPGAAGEACRAGTCHAGLSCVFEDRGTNVWNYLCEPPLVEGAACGVFGHAPCASHLYCASAGTCARRAAEGAACTDANGCGSGLVCAGLTGSGSWTCRRRADAGGACDPRDWNSRCPADMRCDPTLKVCALAAGFEGAECEPTIRSCSAHYFDVPLCCDPATRKCAAKAGLGGACALAAIDPCAEGICDPATLVCVARCF